MKRGLQETCAHSEETRLFGSRASRSAIHPSTGYICDSPADADSKLSGQTPGYVYLRDGQPNADMLSEKCRKLHRADHAVVTSSGMSAIALALVSQLESGDHVLLSDRLYGKTAGFVKTELGRFGVTSSVADMTNNGFVESAPKATRMLVAETISNPRLRVFDLEQLSAAAKKLNAVLFVDNTFATPILCRPLEHGADLVMESLTKFMNGHGDATMGMLCGREPNWERVPTTLSTWGMTSSAFDCWLIERGLMTLQLRMSSASQSAKSVAEKLNSNPVVREVDYPGLIGHPDIELARKQFDKSSQKQTLFGNMLTFTLKGGLEAASSFIQSVESIEFVPSLGEQATTLSHPLSTSHRGLDEASLERLGIDGGTIRLSIGLESADFIEEAILSALAGMDS